jgi:hypothetical protein
MNARPPAFSLIDVKLLFLLMHMKYILSIVAVVFLFSCKENERPTTSTNQTSDSPAGKIPAIPTQPYNPYSEVDISPMDMSYFPLEYPKLKMDGRVSDPPLMRVIYSRPHKGGRKIFGGIVQYGSYWRLGANEATEIEFFRGVTIQDKKIKAGRYNIYCYPEASKWTIVLNSNLFSWGLRADTTKETARFDIPVNKISPVEYFSMVFQHTNDGANLVMAWDDVEAKLPIVF